MAILNWRKVNYVIKKWENECANPWWVYIETAFPALLVAVFTLFTWGKSDIVRFRAGRGGSKWTKRLTKRNKIFHPFGSSKGIKFFFRFDGILQRILWWWLVADVIAEFAFQWTTLLYNTEYCRAGQGAGSLQRSALPFLFPNTVDWGFLSFIILEENTAGWLQSNLDCFLPPGEYFAVLSVSLAVRQGNPVNVQSRLRLTGVGSPQNWESDPVTDPGAETDDALVSASFTVGFGQTGRLTWEHIGEGGGFLDMTQGAIVVGRSGINSKN